MKDFRKYCDKAPVPVKKIAYELGIRIWITKKFPDYISGKLIRDFRFSGESGYAIIVNGNHSEHRRRFTIAHEIGHFLLHRHLIGDSIVDDEFYRSKLDGRKEREANEFANNLLMPFPLIYKLMVSGVTVLSELAKRLNVSEQMLAVHLGVPIQSLERESKEVGALQLKTMRM